MTEHLSDESAAGTIRPKSLWPAVRGMALMLFGLAFAASSARALDIYNPKPDSDDVVMPLPCGGSMVFRRVYTVYGDPASQMRMKDAEFQAGTDDSASPHAQQLRRASVQGGFADSRGYFYLIGKYEVTDLQYRMLTADKCPAVRGLDPRKSPELLPAVNISWFEAMEAARRYSGFLQQAQKLPALSSGARAKEKPTARLPTDSEWEFAARGGLAAPAALFANDLPFAEQERLADYAWVKTRTGEKSRLHPPADGNLRPNPLKIYDMLGNAMEMTCEPFHAVRTGRLHGQAGGFTVRGGGFRTEEKNVTSAYRAEKPYFTKGAETRAPDTGMRLVLAVPVAYASSEVKELNSQAQALETESTGRAGAQQDQSVELIDRMLARTREAVQELEKSEQNNRQLADEKEVLLNANQRLRSANGELRESLAALRGQVVQANGDRDAMRDVAVRASIRLGGFLCHSMSQEQASVNYARTLMERYKEAMATLAQAKSGYENYRSAYEQGRQTLNGLSSYYSNTLAEAVSTYELRLFDEQAAAVLESSAPGLKAYIRKYLEHIRKYRERSRDLSRNLSMWTAECYNIGRNAAAPQTQQRSGTQKQGR